MKESATAMTVDYRRGEPPAPAKLTCKRYERGHGG